MSTTTTITLNYEQAEVLRQALNLAHNVAASDGMINARDDEDLIAEVQKEVDDTAAMMRRVEQAQDRIEAKDAVDVEARQWIAAHGRAARFADADQSVVKRIRQLLNQ